MEIDFKKRKMRYSFIADGRYIAVDWFSHPIPGGADRQFTYTRRRLHNRKLCYVCRTCAGDSYVTNPAADARIFV